jgi:hypothetical protein
MDGSLGEYFEGTLEKPLKNVLDACNVVKKIL